MKTSFFNKFTLRIGIITDTLLMVFAFFASYYLKYQSFTDIYTNKQFVLFSFLSISWLWLIFLLKPYDYKNRKYEIPLLITNLFKLLIFQFALIAIFWMLTMDISYSRLRMAYYFSVIFVLGSSYRMVIVYLLRFFRSNGIGTKKYIIIGKGNISQSIVDYYQGRPENGLTFEGFFDFISAENFEQSLKKVEDFIIENQIDYVYCSSPYVNSTQVSRLLEFAANHQVELKMIMDYEGFLKNGLAIEYHDFIPVVNISKNPPQIEQGETIKRIFDIVFCVFVMILGFPVFYLIGLITKLTSKGPIFYKSERIGHWGKKIQIYKFRSMVVNADEIAHQLMNGDMHSMGDEDPRITAWGRFMRKTRIDELPQFFNVLKGEMTVVGPRPLPDYDLEMIKNVSVLKYNLLISMKPGLTSIGQVKFGYAATTEENIARVNYDLLYLNKNSLTLDIWIILKTAKIMLQAKGR